MNELDKSSVGIPAVEAPLSLEHYFSDINFQRLLDFAEEVCLTKPLDQLKHQDSPSSLNSRIIHKGGALALRVALEMQMNIEHNQPPEFAISKADDDLQGITTDSILREPRNFFDEANPQNIEKAEQFGKAIIEESFAVLGVDAEAHAQNMANGDAKQQLEEVKWLCERILEISDDKKGEMQGDDTTHYHPIRLSPKFMGEYPNHNLTPTCLGVSILASSFFERAGTPYMHAGIQFERRRHRMDGTSLTLEDISKVLGDQESETYSPILSEMLMEHSDKAFNEVIEDVGYHAGIYVRLADGMWVQVDPYISHEPELLVDKLNDELDTMFDTLKEFEPVAPHLELSYSTDLLSLPFGIMHAVNELATEQDKDFDPQAFLTAVKTFLSDKESTKQKIFEAYILPKFDRLRKMDGEEFGHVAIYSSINHLYENVNIAAGTHMVDDVVQRTFYKMFDKYVLWGESLEDVRQRSIGDAAFFARRMQDLINLPFVMCGSIVMEDSKENYFNMAVHQSVELGLPHARVGFSVLSDLAAYCDDSLPPSFWAAHWPSLIPITETMPRENNDSSQKQYLRNLSAWANRRTLTYIKSHSIIDEYVRSADSQEA